jgi:LAO/AO transport system kinase
MLPWCDEGVFMRSLAASSGGGALAKATPDVINIMAALGRDIIILETLGSGQADVEVAALSDVCLLVLNPGSGDDIQMLKAGILEVADILVINKADKDGATGLKKGLEFMLETRAYKVKSPVILTQAIYGEGIAELAAGILERRQTAALKPAVGGKK